MADDPANPSDANPPPTPPTAAADNTPGSAPAEPLKAEVSRTDSPGAGISAAPAQAAAPKPAPPKSAAPAAEHAPKATPPSRPRQGESGREPAGAVRDRHLAVGQLART